MKKRFIFASILAATAVISLASCNQQASTPTSTPTSVPTSTPTSKPTSTPTSAPTSKPTSAPTSAPTSTPSTETVHVSSLDLSGYKTNFKIGDDFLAGDLKCIATMVDNTTKEVPLNDLTIDSSNVNMNKAGTYDVKVTYKGVDSTYTVYVNYETIGDAISDSIKEMNKVSNGTLVCKNELVNSTVGFNLTKTENYTYGKSFVKIDFVENGTTHYYSTYNGKVLGVEVNGDTKTKITSRADGGQIFEEETQYIGTDFFSNGYMTAFGAEGLVDYIYEYMTSDVYGQVTQKIENGVYSFGFNLIQKISGKIFFKRVEVEFTLNEFGNIATANCKLISYNDNIIESLDDEAVKSLPLTLSKAQDEDGKNKDIFILNEDAKICSISSYSFSQTHGERHNDNENPYTIDKVQISSFKVYDSENNEIEDNKQYVLDLDNGNVVGEADVNYKHKYSFEYDIREILPETAISTIDKINVSIVGTYKNGNPINSDDYLIYASLTDNHLTLRINTPCDFDLVLSSDHYTRTIKYSVDYESPYKIGAKVCEAGEKNEFVSASEYTMYQSNELYLIADIPANYDPNYTLELPEGVKASLVKTNLNGVECYKFVATEKGNYTITVKSAPKADGTAGVTSTITVEVMENPNVSEILSGNYEVEIANTKYSISLTPSADNSLEGTAVITNTTTNLTETVKYNYSTESFVTNHVSGESFGFEFDLSTKYILSLASGKNKYELARPGQSEEDLKKALALLNGTYTATFTAVGATYDYKFTSDGDGLATGKLEVSNGSQSGIYAYTFDITTRKINTVYQSGKKLLGSQELTITTDLKIHTSFFGGADLEKKTYDINAILSGKYTLTDSTQTYNIEFKDNKLYVKRTSNGSTREATYVYEYNESTGLVNVTRKEGKKSTYIENNLYIVDGALCLKGFVMNNDGTQSFVYTPFVREKIKISEAFIGEWVSNASEENIVIKEDSVTISGSETTIKTFDGTTLVVNESSYFGDVTITLSDSKLTVVLNGVTYSFSLKGSTKVEIPESLVGTWSNEGASFTITADGKIYDDGYTYNITSITNEKIAGVDVEDSSYTIEIIINSDGTLTYSDLVYTKENGTTEAVKVNSSFVGTWVNGESSLVITEDSVTYNGNVLTVVSCTETELTVYGNEFAQTTLKLSTDKNSIVLDNYTYTKKTIELKVPSYFIGKWVDSTDPSYKMEITESELIINGGLKLTVSSVEENKVTFGSDSSKIELTYNKDTNTLTDQSGYTYKVDNSIDSSVVPDAFIGEWASADNSTVVVFEKKGVKYGDDYAQSFTVVDEKTVVISYYGTDITFKLNDDGTITATFSGSNTILTKKQ